jgi:hypothetical protein
MNNEFKKSKSNNETRYTLESMTAGATGSGSVATATGSLGKVQKRGNILAQEAGKDKVPATTPRNFVAKNAKSSGAGAHKDKKKEQKQGVEKHKKPYMESLRTKIDQLKSKLAEQGVAEGDRPFRGVGGAFNRGDDERHDLDPTDWYFVKDGKMFAVSVYPNQEREAMSRGYSRTRADAKAKASQQGVAEGSDSEELADEVYAEFERTYPNLARRADERTIHAAIIDVLNYGGDSNPSALAQDVARAVKRNMQQGVSEGPPKDPNAPKLVQDRKTGKWYDPNKEFEKKMNSPEVMAQMKRMAQKEGVEDRTSYQVAKILSDRGIKYDPAQENELINAIGMVLVKELNMTPKEARNLISYDEDFVADTLGELRSMEQSVSEVDVYMESLAQSLQQVLSEKAVSKKQQKFMGMVHAAQKGEKPASKEVAKTAKTMKKGDAEDFASTKHKGLPEKKQSKK